jgi:hypothetical protein
MEECLGDDSMWRATFAKIATMRLLPRPKDVHEPRETHKSRRGKAGRRRVVFALGREFESLEDMHRSPPAILRSLAQFTWRAGCRKTPDSHSTSVASAVAWIIIPRALDAPFVPSKMAVHLRIITFPLTLHVYDQV